MAMQSSMHCGHAVCIATPTEDTDARFKFNSDIQREIRDFEKLKVSKVAVISVAGAFRKGKSFLLNFFLRYLRSGGRSDWMRATACERGDVQLSDGFHWRSGSERDTAGILIWSEPFFIPMPDGEEVAVLLMDTQGTFDHQSTQQDCTTIFAFSTLLSSVQIFNISQNIQETDLQYLRLFVEFASMASTRSKESSALQHLCFLVRDWQNPEEYEYGLKGGEEYLANVLACDSRRPKENRELRQGILRNFKRSSCCLLPHPGKAVSDVKFQGELNRLEREFVQQLEMFIPLIASPRNITIKKLNGEDLTGRQVFILLESYCNAFSCCGIPTVKGIFAATMETANTSAVMQAIELFETQVSGLFNGSKDVGNLNDALSNIEGQALQLFDSRCMAPDDVATRRERQTLRRDLAERRSHHKDLMEARVEKIRAEKWNETLVSKLCDAQRERNAQNQQEEKMREGFSRRLVAAREATITRESVKNMLTEQGARDAAACRRQAEARNRDLQRRMEEQAEQSQQLEQERLIHHLLMQRQRQIMQANIMFLEHMRHSMQNESQIGCSIL